MSFGAIELVAIVACVALVVTGFRRGRGPMGIRGTRQTRDEPRGRERVANTERDARLERLEHAVDAIAVEVERIGEGQRFLTKVLANRSPDQQPVEPAPKGSPSRSS